VRADPPILYRRVTREVANKFDVPLRTMQDIWHKGQPDGLQEIKNKLAGVVGRKKIEISSDTIQAIGFFAGIQALFHKGVSNNIEEIVSRVQKAYQDFPIDRSNRIFLTQQGCMMVVMKQNGGQYYDITHMRKKTLEMPGEFPITLECDRDLYNQVIAFVS
jgi:hypothetical protein